MNLYCPRCRKSYEEGAQRFCLNDGSRLVRARVDAVNQPFSSQNKTESRKEPQKGVFSSLVNKASTPEKNDEMLPEIPRFIPRMESADDDLLDLGIASPARVQPPQRAFPEASVSPQGMSSQPSAPPRVASDEPSFDEVTEPKTAAKVINLDDVSLQSAPLGDRAVNPRGRMAFDWEQPNVLLGQVLKGRYFIQRRLGQDDFRIAYLAQDRAAFNKNVIFNILAEEADQEAAEERVSLSHVNHPHMVRMLDNGILPEGMPYMITEYVDGRSLRDLMRAEEKIPALQTAKIVKQIGIALGEAQRAGVWHYDLRPGKVSLSGTGESEQVKVGDFAIPHRYTGSRSDIKTMAYQSSEDLQGDEITPASHTYSLAVIACEMLTGKLPYYFSSKRELADLQGKGFNQQEVSREVAPEVREVLAKGLAFRAEDRYPTPRDFADALYYALLTTAPADEPAFVDSSQSAREIERRAGYVGKDFVTAEPTMQAERAAISEPTVEAAAAADAKLADDAAAIPGGFKITSPSISTLRKSAHRELDAVGGDSSIQLTANAGESAAPIVAVEKRPADGTGAINWWMVGACLLGLLLFGAGIYATLNYLRGDQGQTVQVEQGANSAANSVAAAADPNSNAAVNANAANSIASAIADEANPEPRVIDPPADSQYYQNAKEKIDKSLEKKFRGFSVYYPNSWQKNESRQNFLDVSRNAPTGTPIEQMLVSWYESYGTFNTDRDSFPGLVKEVNSKLTSQIPKYQFLGEGETFINNGRKVYEMKFQGEGQTKNGEKILIWGRKIFMPAGRRGIKSGLVITMLATNLSQDVLSADEVGKKGDLAKVLETFEPDPLDTF